MQCETTNISINIYTLFWASRAACAPLPIFQNETFRLDGKSVRWCDIVNSWWGANLVSATASFLRRVKVLMGNALQPSRCQTLVCSWYFFFFFMFAYVISVNLFFSPFLFTGWQIRKVLQFFTGCHNLDSRYLLWYVKGHFTPSL